MTIDNIIKIYADLVDKGYNKVPVSAETILTLAKAIKGLQEGFRISRKVIK